MSIDSSFLAPQRASFPFLDRKERRSSTLDRLESLLVQDGFSTRFLPESNEKLEENLRFGLTRSLRNYTSQLIGGDFLREDGTPRNRFVLGFSPDTAQLFPWFSTVCAKIARNDLFLHSEAATHLQLYQRLQEQHLTEDIRIPVPIAEYSHVSPNEDAFVIERFSREGGSTTWQNLVNQIRTHDGIPFLAEEVRDQITTLYEQLHELGVLHGDAQEGNLYLFKPQVKSVHIPGQRSIHIVTEIERPALLDFERTILFDRPEKNEGRFTHERQMIGKMLQNVLEIDNESSSSEIKDAYATWRTRRK